MEDKEPFQFGQLPEFQKGDGPFSSQREAATPGVYSNSIPLQKGSFFKRGLAFLLDLWLVYWICLFFVWLARQAVHSAILGEGSIQENSPFAGPLLFTVGGIWPFLAFFYFTFFSWSAGQTPGKKIAGLRIISKYGKALSFFQAGVRTLSYLLSVLSLGIGFYMALFSREGRALHDWISSTRVIRN